MGVQLRMIYAENDLTRLILLIAGGEGFLLNEWNIFPTTIECQSNYFSHESGFYVFLQRLRDAWDLEGRLAGGEGEKRHEECNTRQAINAQTGDKIYQYVLCEGKTPLEICAINSDLYIRGEEWPATVLIDMLWGFTHKEYAD